VLPTHRRRGILREMMAVQLDDVAEREEPVAVLTASEAVIYGRFGYGVGAQFAKVAVDPRRSAFVADPDVPGSIRLAWSGDTEAVASMAEIYDGWRRTRPGGLSRHEGWWGVVQRDGEHFQYGRGPAYYALHEDEDGVPDGYALYRIKHDVEDEEENEVYVEEVVATDPGVDAALWRYLLDLDLTKKVVGMTIPVDDPLKWRLADPRALTVDYLEDWLWVRIVDVPAALEARTYSTSARLMVEVVDDFRPDGRAGGTFRLDASADGAVCERADGEAADLTITVDALGTAWLGAAPVSTLAAAGRAVGDAETLRLADALFASHPAPYCNHGF
jgi:predicted acetyltransferase